MAKMRPGMGPELEAYADVMEGLNNQAVARNKQVASTTPRDSMSEEHDALVRKLIRQERLPEEGRIAALADLEAFRQKKFKDPDAPEYEYELLESGDFAVFRDGRRTGTAKEGTTAHQSISQVQLKKAPLPVPGMAPAPAAPAVPASPAGPAAAVDPKLFVSREDLREKARDVGMGALLGPYEGEKEKLMKRAREATAQSRRTLQIPGQEIRDTRTPVSKMPMPFTPSAALRKRRDELMPQPVMEEEEETVAMVEKD